MFSSLFQREVVFTSRPRTRSNSNEKVHRKNAKGSIITVIAILLINLLVYIEFRHDFIHKSSLLCPL